MKPKFLYKLSLLFLLTAGPFFSVFIYAQETVASARHYTGKSFLLDGERQPFHIELSNPTSSSLQEVTVTVSFTAELEVRGLDGDCSESKPGSSTEITCTIAEVEPRSFQQLSYDIVGDVDLRPGFSVSTSVSSVGGSILVQSQDTDSLGLLDNSRLVEGPIFDIFVARNILLDSDGDGVSDASELSIGTDPSNRFSVSNRNAVIDVLVLQSEETDRHYEGRFGGRVDYLLAATNQFYKENNVGITLRLAAFGTVDYSSSAQTVTDIFNELFERSNTAFNDIDLMIKNTGADVVLFAHPVFPSAVVDPNADPDIAPTLFCSVAQTNADAVQGDFYKEAFGFRMLSVLNSSRDCLGAANLAVPLALNMGIVRTRQSNPEGGTFSFSSGHIQGNYFETFVPASITPETAAPDTVVEVRGVGINILSSPERLCLGRPCGVDRNDLVNGADAVFSLNATAHIVADLSPTVTPLSASDIEPKVTIAASNKESIEVRQFSNSRKIVRGDWVSIQVEARNTSADVLHNLEFRFVSSFDSELFRTGDNQCSILAASGAELSQDLFGSREGQGSIVCYVNNLQPGQVAGFSYSVRVDNSISDFGQNGFLSLAGVNNQLMRDGQACFIVSETSAESGVASDVCSLFTADSNLFTDPTRELDGINPALLPEIIGSVFTVPFVRLFDGGLISAQFRVIEGTARSYELIDLNNLSSFLSPNTAAQFAEDGQLAISNATIDGVGGYNMILRLAEGAGAPTFVESEVYRP